MPKGTTIMSVMLASDKTQLSRFSGDKNMHPVYISLGNIHKDMRNKPSRQGWMLLAKLPTSKFAAFKARLDASASEKKAMPGILQKRLFHAAMGIVLAPLKKMEVTQAVDASGNTRRVMPILMSWLADLEEHWLILGLAKSSCPKCTARTRDFDTPHIHDQLPRTGDSILADIQDILDLPFEEKLDVWQFHGLAGEKGLAGVERLCWEGLPVDMCRVVCVDALHGLHKMFKDHIVKWVTLVVGENDLDLLFMAQPRRTGFRNFHSGISFIQQCTGRENRDIERQILGAIAGQEDLDPRVLKCVRALLDFIFMAGFPVHTERTLAEMQRHLDIFWKNIRVFVELSARVGKSGNLIEEFAIPKLHLLFHYLMNIRDLGTVDNYSTEICEALHIPFCKNAYKATNRKDYDQQIINYLTRLAALTEYTAYLAWRSKSWDDDETVDGYNDDDDDDDDENSNLVSAVQPSMSVQTSRGSLDASNTVLETALAVS